MKLSDVQLAYKRIPPLVLMDLVHKCFAGTTTFDPDPRVHALNEGKRQVWLHMNTMIGLTQEQITRLYAGEPIMATQEIDDGGN